MASQGLSLLIAVANAKAAAECPDGNEVDDGIGTYRAPGTPAPARSGRRRPESALTPRLTRAEVIPIARAPRLAEPPSLSSSSAIRSATASGPVSAPAASEPAADAPPPGCAEAIGAC